MNRAQQLKILENTAEVLKQTKREAGKDDICCREDLFNCAGVNCTDCLFNINTLNEFTESSQSIFNITLADE